MTTRPHLALAGTALAVSRTLNARASLDIPGPVVPMTLQSLAVYVAARAPAIACMTLRVRPSIAR